LSSFISRYFYLSRYFGDYFYFFYSSRIIGYFIQQGLLHYVYRSASRGQSLLYWLLTVIIRILYRACR